VVGTTCGKEQGVAEETERLKLTDRQKTRLLGLALELDKPAMAANEDEERGDLLCDVLRRPLPGDLPSREPLAPRTDGSCQGLCSVLGPPLGELFQDPKTDIAVLKQIKERAKKLGEHASSKTEKDVFLVLYFAAIASASAFHDERITRHSDQDLTRFFDLYGQAGWVPRDMKGLFRKARQQFSQDKRGG
jgi:hypothetical protein